MAVDSKHSSYTSSLISWQFMRACISGDSAIKAGGKTYVPELSGQTEAQYKAYIGRPAFSGYTQRVLDGLTGLIFSKAPSVIAPPRLEELFDNFDLNGSTLTDYVQDLTSEVESVGRVNCLVDMGRDATQNRPYATIYKTENVINWKHQNINNQNTLVMVVLQETEDFWEDMFTNKPKTIYRVLLLSDSKTLSTLHYQQHIYRPKESSQGSKSEYDIEVVVPLMNGKPLTYIPFVGITPEKLTIEPSKPPLLDLANVEKAHFKIDVDFYHGMHWTAVPTAWGRAINPKEIEGFTVGGTNLTVFSKPDAELKYLEFEGKGLGTLQEEKEKLVERIVVLGSNMLQGDKKTAEAENTVAMRSAGQNASLISTADTISRGVTRILEIMAEWMGVEREWETKDKEDKVIKNKISYKLNTDFNLKPMAPQMIKELITGKALGSVPSKVLYDNFVKGEIINAEEISYEQYMEMLSEEAPIAAPSALPPKPTNNDVDIKKIADKVGAN